MSPSFAFKAILPILLWCGLGWFWAKKEIHFPFLGLVTQLDRPKTFVSILLLDALTASFFTAVLLDIF